MAHRMTTLKLHIDNFPASIDSDVTNDYLRAAVDLDALPAGVTLDVERCLLQGEATHIPIALAQIRAALVAIGHGTVEADDECGDPVLSASPVVSD